MNTNHVSIWIADLGVWPLVLMLFANLMFRRHGKAALMKRMASLYQAIAVFAITTLAVFIVERELSDLYFYAGSIVVCGLLVFFRHKVFPYRLTCPQCGKKLDVKTIYFMDNHLCATCCDTDKDENEVPESQIQTEESELT